MVLLLADSFRSESDNNSTGFIRSLLIGSVDGIESPGTYTLEVRIYKKCYNSLKIYSHEESYSCTIKNNSRVCNFSIDIFRRYKTVNEFQSEMLDCYLLTRVQYFLLQKSLVHHISSAYYH